jgi:hypothetical protein
VVLTPTETAVAIPARYVANPIPPPPPAILIFTVFPLTAKVFPVPIKFNVVTP